MSPDVDFPPDLRSLESEYELIREIGQGGMAAVYLARHRASGQVVAIKAVRARYVDDPDALRRFAREARTVAVLDHPNIVRTEAIEQIGDRAVAIIMEHVAGGTVRDRLREFGSLGAEETESILRDVANALGYAHRHGIVHRDVKPENIFLDPNRRRALLSDFGIARPIDSDAGIITLLGASLGTPQYMSPEQIDGEMVDGRSDIYSLGVLGWELLTGRRPWAGENLYGIIYKQKHEDLPRITSLRPRVPANLLFAIEGALIKDKDRRWQTTDAFLEQLTYNPPPLLSQTYPPGPERVDYEPTVQFRRAERVEGEGEAASVAPHESAVDGEDATAIVPAVSPGELTVVDARMPPVELVAPPVAPDRAVSTEPAPNADVPFTFVSGRRRAMQVAGLLVPLGIAAAAMFVLFSGNTRGRVDRSVANVTASDGSIAPDSAVPAPAGLDPSGAGSLAASPPPTGDGRSTLAESRPPRIRTPTRKPIATARPRIAVSPGPSRPRDTTTRGTRPESSRVVASRPPNDSNGATVVAPKPEVPAEAKAAPPPVDDPFKIPGGGDARVRGAPTGAVPSPRCRLASTADQQACLSAYIAAGDVPLDHAFASLVDEMRRVAKTPPGAPDPVTVQRIRVEQRAWMSIRNSECPRSAPVGAGPFWAGAQADCFTEMATARAAELRDAVKRLKKR